MKKLITITLLLLIATPCLRAQRKEISQARSYIKSGKDLDKAVDLMRALLDKDSVNRSNPKIYITWFEAVEKQYAAGNETLYLKQEYDTASLFNYTKTMFDILTTLDSIESMPDEKGRVKIEYRKKHAAILDKYRPNLFFGGSYFVRKGDYAKAFDFLDEYIACKDMPMFEPYNYAANDTKIDDAAYWATYSGYKLKDTEKTMKYAQTAEKDTARLKYVIMYEADAYSLLKDESNYESTLKRGFAQYPTFPYFFPRLMDYYTAHNRLDSALSVTNQALEADADSRLFLYAKSTVLLNMGRNDECEEVTKRLIALCDTVAEPYYNIGMAILNRIVVLEQSPRENKEQIRAEYRKALPYMEKFRVLSPTQSKRWAPALYRIYLNLNMGKQFEDIDKIINRQYDNEAKK